MAEAWDQASSLAAARPLLLQDIERIRTSCTQNHSKEVLVECPDCYGLAIDRIRRRYLESAGPEWFSGRRAFLSDLEAALSEAKTLDLDPSRLDALMQDEKRKWYLENVRTSAISVIAEDSLGGETLMEMLGSRNFLLEELAGEIRHALDLDDAQPEGVASLLDKLSSTTDSQEKLSLLRHGLFAAETEEAVAASERKYYEMLAMGIPARTVVEQIVEDRQASQGARNLEDKHKQRISDLQRARTAHERKKSRKLEGLGSSARDQCPERFYNLPPCLTCGRSVDLKDLLGCGLCQVLEDFNIENAPRPAVWCSEKCYAETHDEHLEREFRSHSCVAGDDCIRVTDKDVHLGGNDADGFQICNECLGMKKASIYCSSRCANNNFAKHREAVHRLSRPARDNADDQDSFVFEPGEASKYYPRHPSDHVTELNDALRDLQRRTGIVIEDSD